MTRSVNPNSDPPSGRLLAQIRAAHRLDEAGAHEQPDPGPGDRAGHGRVAVEELEGALDGGFLDAGTRIEDPDDDGLAFLFGAHESTCVPGGVYLAALLSMFRTICST